MSDLSRFRKAFNTLTGNDPFPWQEEFYKQLMHGKVRPSCDIPTGLGKTAVIPIWLIALAHSSQDEAESHRIPRRLVYIVNRRTVVDQATDEAKTLRDRLHGEGELSPEDRGVLEELRRSLAALCAARHESALAISTLRGEWADNGEWKVDPARPAIIIGTVDMIGSKLLFSGYGDGRYKRPHHAGLLGQDSLIVHDEAHLTPAFSRLLRSIVDEQSREHCRPPAEANVALDDRTMRLIELSATTRSAPSSSDQSDDETLRLTDDDYQHPTVSERIHAEKRLKLLHPVDDDETVVERIVGLASGHKDAKARVLVFVRSPEDAKNVREALQKENNTADRVEMLTGTLRGYERDLLAEKPLFRWFKGKEDEETTAFAAGGTAYLVSTSAGEVGVDIDADHLICDLTTLESMIQRLGRVNRRGGKGRTALVDVVAEKDVENGSKETPDDTKRRKGDKATKKDDDLQRREATWKALSELPKGDDDRHDAGPMALRGLAGRLDAWSPQPLSPPVTDILFDAWALTSIWPPMPGQPEVADWLHGIKDVPEPPETVVAWRAEVSVLAEANASERQLARILDIFQVRAAERLRDRSYRVQKELAKIAKRSPTSKAILIKRNQPQWMSLEDLAADKKLLDNATVVLPVEVGGLKDGFLDGGSEAADDVAERTIADQPVRQRVWRDNSGEASLLGGDVNHELITRFRLPLGDDEFAEPDAEDKRRVLEYRVAAAEPDALLGAGDSKDPVPLDKHTGAVVRARS